MGVQLGLFPPMVGPMGWGGGWGCVGRGRGGRRRREGCEERVEGEGHERVGEGQRGVRREAVVGEIDEKDRGVGGEGGGD